MKMKTLSVLAGVSAPLIMTATSGAAFQEIEVRSLGVQSWDGFGGAGSALVVRIYAVFNRPGQDLINGVKGTPMIPMSITTDGTFFQPDLDTPQSTMFWGFYPSLEWDTFVTIGSRGIGPNREPDAPLSLTPGWPGFQASSLGGSNLGWAVTPADPNSDPFNATYWEGNGRVLIMQLSTQDGTSFSGSFGLQYVNNGQAGVTTTEGFAFGVPSPGALGLLGVAGLMARRRRRR